nr:UbiA family prenyltransferase [Luteolibacter marinus]
MRIANAPSVVSNVCLGVFVGATLFNLVVPEVPGHLFVAPVIAGLLLYFAGNLANDWYDRNWDESRRPERALPSGTFRPATYLVAAAATASAGIAVAFFASIACGIIALLILSSIIVYTRIHKQTIWSVVPMGLCRAGLYFLGVFSDWNHYELAELFWRNPKSALILFGIVATLASGLFAYIAGLSLSARYESMPDPPRGPKIIARTLLWFPLLAMPCLLFPLQPTIAWTGMIPFTIWLVVSLTVYRRPTSALVSALLAGIPLVDAILLLPVGLEFHKLSFGDQGFYYAMIAIPFIAFFAGRLLQRVAPAT